MQEKHYAKFDVSAYLDGQLLQTKNCLVSTQGIWQFFIPKPEEQNTDYTGKVVTVDIKSMRLHGYFIREESKAGIYYNIKFIGSDTLSKAILKIEIELNGIFSPWNRRAHRLSTKINNPAIAIPTYALVKLSKPTIHANIINFALGGILLESTYDELASINLNSEIIFDLMMNDNRHFYAIKGKVVRINDEISSQVKRSRSLGIELCPMKKNVNSRYQKLIEDFDMVSGNGINT